MLAVLTLHSAYSVCILTSSKQIIFDDELQIITTINLSVSSPVLGYILCALEPFLLFVVDTHVSTHRDS